MTEDEVVHITRAYIEGLFPRVCPNCGLQFGSLREYLELTTHLESPIIWDNIHEEIPSDPLGPMSFANCRCGTTLTVASLEMPADLLVELMTWAKGECQRRSMTMPELLHEIRDRIDTDVLAAALQQ